MYLYVMGRAHCGSTILGIVLGGASTVVGVGEIVSGLERYAPGTETCSCGTAMHECPFWTEVRSHFEAEGFAWSDLAEASRWQTDIRRWPSTWLAASDEPRRRHLAAMTAAFARALAATSGKPHVLDTNKETTRALFLLRWLPEARIIHLVRDPLAIQQSHLWRLRADKGLHFMRRKLKAGEAATPALVALGALSWLIGSALAEVVERMAPARVVRLRYEDLCSDPAGSLRRIQSVLGVPVDEVLEKLEARQPFTVGHNVGGNHIRHATAVTFEPKDSTSRGALPRWARVLTLSVCWPLMLRYGYPVTGRA